MTREQFNALINLGFTGDQILAIANTGKPVQNAQVEKRDPEPQAVQTAQTAQPETKTEENETVKMLKEMLGLMKINNINSLSMNPEPEKTGADILADIIDPL